MKSTTCSGRATFTIHAPILLLDQIDDCKTLIASTRTKLIIGCRLPGAARYSNSRSVCEQPFSHCYNAVFAKT
jgi:hypothetical protein